MGTNKISWLIVISFVETSLLLAGFFTFAPETPGGNLAGYSHLRLLSLIVLCLAWMLLALGIVLVFTANKWKWLCAVEKRLLEKDHLYHMVWLFCAFMLIPFYGFIYTYITLPAGLRPFFAWVWLMLGQTAFFLRCSYRQVWKERNYAGRYPNLPHIRNLLSAQKKSFFLLSIIGLIYFLAFIPVNLQGTSSEHEFFLTGGDEYVIYPILTSIMTPGDTARETVYRIIEYDDYHYGYPFYVTSALTLLPVKIIYGDEFSGQYRINLLLLRQFVSVLPIILSALIISYLGTRWRNWSFSLLVFLLILSLPGVVRYNTAFWHPDGLTVLCVCLTLFLLDRDRLRFGQDFYLAAITCGLAIGIRLYGIFFVLAITGYVLAGIWRKQLTAGKVISRTVIFLCIICMTVIVTNPFLLDPGARLRLTATLSEKSMEMREGYGEPDPENIYRTGWDAWLPFMTLNFGSAAFLLFLIVSISIAIVFSTERIYPATLLAWAVVVGGFLVYGVAVKSFQYMLPLFIPLYGGSLLLPQVLKKGRIRNVINWASVGFCSVQLVMNVVSILSIFEA